MFKEPIDYLKHIADECSYHLSVSNGLSKDDLDDENLKRAFPFVEIPARCLNK